MIRSRLDFVEVFLTLKMHQIQLIDQTEFLQHLDGAVNRRAVNFRFAFSRSFEEGLRVKVRFGLLDRLDESPALRRQSDAFDG